VAVVEKFYSYYPKMLLTLVVKERDVCSTFLPMKEVYPELLNDSDREGTPVDR